MPGFDGTGPEGRGPVTGGGFGPCGAGRFRDADYRGRGHGRFINRGYGRGYGPGPNYVSEPVEEKAQLAKKIEQLKAALAETERCISELK